MKVVILAGGFGTRISEESAFKPKPMIEIGGMPILWHIMKTYSAYGYNEFVICAGYKQHVIKEWFADYFLHTSDITFDYTHGTNEMIVHNICTLLQLLRQHDGCANRRGGLIRHDARDPLRGVWQQHNHQHERQRGGNQPQQPLSDAFHRRPPVQICS